MNSIIRNNGVLPFSVNVRSYLKQVISTYTSKNCRSFNYYRFNSAFDLKRTGYWDKHFNPMYVEVLTDASRDFDLALAVNNPKHYAFMAVDYEFPTTAPPITHELYFDNLNMIEQRKGLRLNPQGIITEMKDVIKHKKIPTFIPWNEENGTDAFATTIMKCKRKVNAIVGFKDLSRVWCMITSRGDKGDNKIIRDVVKTVKSNEAYYDLHEVVEDITGMSYADFMAE